MARQIQGGSFHDHRLPEPPARPVGDPGAVLLHGPRARINSVGTRDLPVWDAKGKSKILGDLMGEEGIGEYAAIYHGMSTTWTTRSGVSCAGWTSLASRTTRLWCLPPRIRRDYPGHAPAVAGGDEARRGSPGGHLSGRPSDPIVTRNDTDAIAGIRARDSEVRATPL